MLNSNLNLQQILYFPNGIFNEMIEIDVFNAKEK